MSCIPNKKRPIKKIWKIEEDPAQQIGQCQSKNNSPKIHHSFFWRKKNLKKSKKKKVWYSVDVIQPYAQYQFNIGLNKQNKKLVILFQFYSGKGRAP